MKEPVKNQGFFRLVIWFFNILRTVAIWKSGFFDSLKIVILNPKNRPDNHWGLFLFPTTTQMLIHMPNTTKNQHWILILGSGIYLSIKKGSLFCFVVMRSTEPGWFRLCSWCLWKALNKEGCTGLVPWYLDLRCKSSWILNDFFTEN